MPNNGDDMDDFILYDMVTDGDSLNRNGCLTSILFVLFLAALTAEILFL
jgi:hypothetical protein